jgi:hypothetical protein
MNQRSFWVRALGLIVLLISLVPIGPASQPRQAWSEPTAAPSLATVFQRGPAQLGPALLRPAMAGPVDWREVEASPEGRQWWDAGSLRRDRRGQLSVLSRFQPAAAAPTTEPEAAAATPANAPPPTATETLAAAIANPAASAPAATTSGPAPARRQETRPQAGTLYVMELDCDQELYRDISVNGIPHWGAAWQTAAGESLTMATLRAACAAAPQPHA